MFDTPKKKLSILTLLVSLSLVILLYPQLKEPAVLQMQIEALGWLGIILSLLIISLQMLFPVVPFALLAGINAILFGWLAGFLLSLVGSLLGTSIGFWLARILGQEWAEPRLQKFGKWSPKSERGSFFLIVVARLTPFLPGAVVNYTAGLSKMKFSTFFFASLVGKIPMIAWESWLGHGFWQLAYNPRRFIMASLFGLVIFGIPWTIWYLNRRQHQRANSESDS